MMKYNKANSLLRPGPLLKKRYMTDRILRYIGISAISMAILFLVVLLISIFINAYPAFFKSELKLSLNLPTAFYLDKEYQISKSELDVLMNNSLVKQANISLQDAGKIYNLINQDEVYDVMRKINRNEDIDSLKKLRLTMVIDVNLYINNNNNHRLEPIQTKLIDNLYKKKIIKKVFNYSFFTNSESTQAEIAGLMGGIIGSFYTIFISIIIALPISIITAIYLEEFAPRNKLTSFIEININNLAAIPSIVFGLIGLAIFIDLLEVPRSSSLAGGFTLSLMAMPSIIITTRQALRSVPMSIRNGFMALGASKIQGILHHTLPLSLPGIMTGTILAVSRILGETAPLMMLGMVAFIVDIPKNFLDPAAPLPIQIYLWAQNPEYGFVSKTSAAIIILLFVLITFNMLAVYIRKKYEHRW